MGNWDAVLVNETWGPAEEEQFITESGHIFLGAGGAINRSGVAILVHTRWASGISSFSTSGD
eukprot:734209-Pyramimonas_sp.AAC.1